MSNRRPTRGISVAVVVGLLAGLMVVPTVAADAATTTDPDLTVTKAGLGSGTVTSNPGGIDCGTDCEHAYPIELEEVCEYDPEARERICWYEEVQQAVTLTASAASGSTFTGWSGGCTGTGTCVVTMDEDKTVTATFADTQPPVVTSISPTSGAHQSSINATATATDNVGLEYVYFQVWQDGGERFAGGHYDYSAPYQYYLGDVEELVDGPVRLYVGARDTSDNWSLYRPESPYSEFTIDDTGPTLTITNGPPAKTPDTSVTFEFEASDLSGIASVECKVNDRVADTEWVPCSGGTGSHDTGGSRGGVNNGEYTFYVRATDGAGNTTTTSRGWTVTRMPTAVSLDINKIRRKVGAAGVLRDKWEDQLDPITGATVAVTLLKKKNGRFIKVSSKSDATDSSGRYEASFRRPKATTCKLNAKYAANDIRLGSKTSKTFAC